MVAYMNEGDPVGATLAGIGFIPLLGDAIKWIGKGVRRLLRASDLPGEYVDVVRAENGMQYQSQITGQKWTQIAGRRAGTIREYLLDGSHFDGVEGSVLLDAKDWARRPLGNQKVVDGIVAQASKQSRIAEKYGTRVEWRVSSQTQADATRQILEDAGITNVSVVWVPKA